MLKAEVNRYPGSQRQTEQRGRFHVQSVEQAVEILLIDKGENWKGRLSVTTNVVAQDLVVVGKTSELGIPHSTIHVPRMQKRQGRSCPCHLVKESGSLYLDEPSAPLTHWVAPFCARAPCASHVHTTTPLPGVANQEPPCTALHCA